MKQKHWLVLGMTIFVSMLSSAQQTQGSNTHATVSDSLASKKKFTERIISYFEEAKKDKSNKKFDISFIGGPSYSVDTKLGLGIVASGLYRLDKENMNLQPSAVSIYTNFTTSGFFSIGVENTTIFPEDKYRINYDMNFAFMPSKFYGIGFEAGNNGLYTKYDEYRLSLKLDALRKVLNNTYIGATFSAQHFKADNFEIADMRPNDPINATAIGGGFIIQYDSRDFIPNPAKGWFLKYEQVFFTKALGSNHNFGRTDITARTYQKVWEKGILAFDLNGSFNNGDVPWNMLSQIGGSRQMRGYFIGQFRDKKQINAQVELRQKIYNRHGIALWGGAGNVFENFNQFDWDKTLPAYGIGYRWEFKNRVNIRLDYGIGKGQSGFYFNINESF
ncbi:BamA/TamA family outer membrane protein [Myroides pelagicus]|uniref:BamA/TamA family outer membrane protein n=1 Tax=Myroides pelagicus TaxID=270914 RepID=A0A7K1GKL8_9FLAO|nr:BamA/TamA family outer membrane protein [Myroides pelagicus]MEC4113014.1 BamA/TamA family outer membrane protein [Myroides pelagicus]MTH28983.1 BamA/TamA family outer membrane protein [Myroides pelagicus]